MPLIFGDTGSGVGFRRLEARDASDPLVERFVQAAWAAELARRRPAAPPGRYPLRLQVEYEADGDRIVRMFLEIVQPAREHAVDVALWRAMRATGVLQGLPFTFTRGVRALLTSVVLAVPGGVRPADPGAGAR